MSQRMQAMTAVLLLSFLSAFSAHAALPGLFGNTDENASLAPMLEPLLPAVVNITATGKAQARSSHPLFDDPFFRRFFGDPDESPRGQQPRGLGSGVIVDADKGIVLTNDHVVADAEEIQVRLNDDREFAAELIGSDPESDIAVLRIQAENLVELPIADSDALRVGDFVLAIGNPFGLRQTVTSGIVSGLGRHGLGKRFEDFIQTDASINPGNSGGALINLKGELVGINTAILSRSGGNIGIGFAIPSNLAQSTMSQIVEYGEVRRARLGVVGQNLTSELAKAFELDSTQGVVVAQVVEGSAAAKAGIRERDVITHVNDVKIRDFAELANAVGLRQPGERVTVTLLRDGKRRTVTATLGKDDAAQQAADDTGGDAPSSGSDSDLFAGLEGARFGDLAEDHPLAGEVQGVVVEQVAPRGPAARAGLRPGDVITSVNREDVNSLKAFRKLASSDKKQLLLHIRRGRGALFILIR